MCGVMGDTELFDYFSAYQTAAQYFAGIPRYPTIHWADINAMVRSRLFTTFSQTVITPTADGEKLKGVVMNLTGGNRPIFEQGFGNAGLQQVVWGTFGGDGTINGILNASVLDTRNMVLQIDSDPALSAEETLLNDTLLRVAPVPDANRLRRDGLRWIPKVNGQFSIPVVSLHTLGDMYVPFSMQQIYKRRADANGSGAGWCSVPSVPPAIAISRWPNRWRPSTTWWRGSRTARGPRGTRCWMRRPWPIRPMAAASRSMLAGRMTILSR